MSKTVDELIGVYIEASNAVVWEAEKRGLCPMTLDMQRAGIAAVVRALRDEAELTIRMLEAQAAECFPEINEHGQKHFVRVVMESAAEELKEILGSDAGAATAGAIQPQGEAENGLRRSIEGPEDGAASGAFGLERQGHVPVPGERINLHREPPTASGNIPGRDSDRLPAPHRHEDGGQQVRAVVGVTDGPAGRGLGDSSLNEKVAGVARADDLGIEVTGVDRRETVKQIHEQPEADTYDPSAPATAPATDPPPAVCVWTKRGRHEPGFYNTPHGLCHINHLPKSGGCWCGNPIKFTEAKT